MQQKRYVIIGFSAAGMSAAQAIRNVDQVGEIIAISSEPKPAYNKCLLAKRCAEQISDQDLMILDIEQTAKKNITVCHNTVTAIDRAAKIIHMSDNGQLWYDQLLLATGAQIIIPTIAGVDHVTQGIFTFHTLQDIQAIDAYIVQYAVRQVIVIGAGINGLECADALSKRALQVSIIEKDDLLLRHHDRDIVDQIIKAMPATVTLHHGLVDVIESNHGVIQGVLVNDMLISGQLIVYATGVVPNSDLARVCGLAITQQGSIAVNQTMQTTDPAIFAAGDVIALYDSAQNSVIRSSTWHDAIQQGMIAGFCMAGKPRLYQGTCVVSSTAFFGLTYSFGGITEGEHVKIMQTEDYFLKMYADARGVLKGFALIGSQRTVGILRTALNKAQTIENIAALVDGHPASL